MQNIKGNTTRKNHIFSGKVETLKHRVKLFHRECFKAVFQNSCENPTKQYHKISKYENNQFTIL